MDRTEKQWTERSPPSPAVRPWPPRSLDTELSVTDLSGSTIQRQRKELQLLMAELKDRDRELNAMAVSHHKQLLAWEQDRQKVIRLEQRCSRLDDELQKRNEVIRALTKRVWTVETREKEVQEELGSARQQLCQLQHKQQHVSQRCQDFEEKNQSLNSTLRTLSSQVGSLQVREEELSSMLKLKDKDVSEASGQILDLTGRVRDLETSLTESRSQETKLLRHVEENKRRFREARHEVTHLKEELQQQVTQSSSQREEIIRLKQELQLLHRDLALTGEGDGWRDQLLDLARSKQERTTSELLCLRQVCENQRNDLQMLQSNLESARETLREKTSAALISSQEETACNCPNGCSPAPRGKNPGPVRDTTTVPGAVLRGTGPDDLGVFSLQRTDAEDPLQQLVDESRRSSSRVHSSFLPALSSVTSEPFCSPQSQIPHHRPTAPANDACDTPPKTCPQHAPAWLHTD